MLKENNMDKIFKDKQLKKTLIESINNPVTGEVIGAVKINNNNEIDLDRGIIKVDENQQPVLTPQEQQIMSNEERLAGTDNPIEIHKKAVERESNGNGNNSNGNGNGNGNNNNDE